MAVLESVKRAWSRWVYHGMSAKPLLAKKVYFRLLYGPMTVGYLTAEEGRWRFRYSDEFRKRDDLRPIVQFPDVTRTYESEELWPFFGLRIPSLKQPAVRAAADHYQIADSDKVELLRRFGRRTISNPYELVPE